MYEICEKLQWIFSKKFFTAFPVLKAYHQRIDDLPQIRDLKDSDVLYNWNKLGAKINAVSNHKKFVLRNVDFVC